MLKRLKQKKIAINVKYLIIHVYVGSEKKKYIIF